MLAFMTQPENLAFAVALVLMLGIAVLEGITTLLGAAFSSVLEALLPDFDPPAASGVHLDMDVADGADVEAPYALSRFLSWLRVGKVPILMLLVVFLTAFGLIGLGLQGLAHNVSGHLLPGWLASIPTLLLSLPMVRLFGGVLERIIPSDETEAVSVDSLVGRIATITIGTASVGRPAEARVSDSYGTTHLLMVEPDLQQDSFSAGESVLLVKREDSVFKVIANNNPSLQND